MILQPCGAIRCAIALRRNTLRYCLAAQYATLLPCGAIRCAITLRRNTLRYYLAAQYATLLPCGAIRYAIAPYVFFDLYDEWWRVVDASR
ncbi:MAG: hypothetical protein PHW13_09770 [Methylococcales bacterium]|nr:hypothetical protein [Methylococcales bacterium]